MHNELVPVYTYEIYCVYIQAVVRQSFSEPERIVLNMKHKMMFKKREKHMQSLHKTQLKKSLHLPITISPQTHTMACKRSCYWDSISVYFIKRR